MNMYVLSTDVSNTDLMNLLLTEPRNQVYLDSSLWYSASGMIEVCKVALLV